MSEPAAINYQPLEGMKHSLRAAYKTSMKNWRGQVVFWLLVVVAPIVILVLAKNLAGLFFCLLYLVYLASQAEKYRDHLWDDFAAANGWPIDVQTPPQQLVPPSLQFGHNFGFSPIIMASIGQLTCDLLAYHTIVGEGKNQMRLDYTVVRVPLPTALPHILLLSKKTHISLTRDLADKQEIHLEGDFNNYFSLQIEKGQQIDVLTVMTPDVMQALVQYDQTEDVEIIGGSLYFIMSYDRRDPDHLRKLITSVVASSQQLMENLQLEQVPAVATPPNTPIATPPVAPTANLV